MNSITPDSNYTGIITVTLSGVAVSGPDVDSLEGFILKAHPSNTSVVWIFDDGSAKTAGFPLSVGEMIIINVPNLKLLDFGADANAQKICYIKV